ncbi:MAG TPA: hypothetical protein VG148_01835 [Pyrinomonadaceae bacterium]|nr:hypothetical protein [Pyrinomonadaceae bacterium]
MEKLRRLDEAAAAGGGGDYRRLTRRLYPGLFVAVAGMRQGELKTDLDTAAFLYEEVGRAWSAAGDAPPDCERERPDTYRPLCLGPAGGSVRQLLLAKARLHARWAEAAVKAFRGAADGETSRLLSEMKAARAYDLLIAARVSETLKSLEEIVHTSPSYADYLEHRAEAKVSPEKLEAEFVGALGRAGALLGWLPRSPVYYHLSSARRSYGDGLFWYWKVHGSKKMVVSAAAGFERDPLQEMRLDAGRVGYTVVTNWKAAAKYTRLAEQSLAAVAR